MVASCKLDMAGPCTLRALTSHQGRVQFTRVTRVESTIFKTDLIQNINSGRHVTYTWRTIFRLSTAQARTAVSGMRTATHIVRIILVMIRLGPGRVPHQGTHILYDPVIFFA